MCYDLCYAFGYLPKETWELEFEDFMNLWVYHINKKDLEDLNYVINTARSIGLSMSKKPKVPEYEKTFVERKNEEEKLPTYVDSEEELTQLFSKMRMKKDGS